MQQHEIDSHRRSDRATYDQRVPLHRRPPEELVRDQILRPHNEFFDPTLNTHATVNS